MIFNLVTKPISDDFFSLASVFTMSESFAQSKLDAAKRLHEAESFVVGAEEVLKVRSEIVALVNDANAIKIQCWWRGKKMSHRIKLKGKERHHRQIERKAAVTIQCAWRKTCAWKKLLKLKLTARKIRLSATKLSSKMRSYLVRKHLDNTQTYTFQSAVVTSKLKGSVPDGAYLVLSTMLLDTTSLTLATHNYTCTERALAGDPAVANELKCIALQKTDAGKITSPNEVRFDDVVVSSLFIHAILVVSVMDNESNCYGQVIQLNWVKLKHGNPFT